jgi:hypothetical protein
MFENERQHGAGTISVAWSKPTPNASLEYGPHDAWQVNCPLVFAPPVLQSYLKRPGFGGASGGSARIHCANSCACTDGTERFGMIPPHGPCPP